MFVRSYHYGFNGMEKDDEVKGVTGSSYDFNTRMYDSRLSRFLSLDPLARNYPSVIDYASFNNNPVIFIDPTGKGGELVITGENTAILKIRIVLFSDVVDETALQALQASTQDYVGTNLNSTFQLQTVNSH
jgi:RHS repeat-associated protein